jgi:hypothetical protein
MSVERRADPIAVGIEACPNAAHPCPRLLSELSHLRVTVALNSTLGISDVS